MGCGQGRTPQSTQQTIARLFEQGKTRRAMFHRLSLCCHAGDCGRLCRWLVKGPGVRAFCVGPAGDVRRDLYAALAKPDFRCPDGRF